LQSVSEQRHQTEAATAAWARRAAEKAIEINETPSRNVDITCNVTSNVASEQTGTKGRERNGENGGVDERSIGNVAVTVLIAGPLSKDSPKNTRPVRQRRGAAEGKAQA
jgi:hypothetical protein